MRKIQKFKGYTLYELLYVIFGVGLLGVGLYVAYLLIFALQKYISS